MNADAGDTAIAGGVSGPVRTIMTPTLNQASFIEAAPRSVAESPLDEIHEIDEAQRLHC